MLFQFSVIPHSLAGQTMSKSITELADSIAKLEKQLSEELDRQ